MIDRLLNDRRGVSETLGYVLVFGIVVSVMSLVFVSGITGLESSQQHEQDRNMERAFDVLADNLEDIHYHDAPSRATEVRLSEGSISVEDTSRMGVNITDDSEIDRRMLPQSIAYEGNNGQVVYEGGAVFRTDDDGSVMIVEPPWVVTDDRLIIPFIWTEAEGGQSSVTGEGTYLIGAEATSTRLAESYEHDTGSATIEIRIESPRADAWEQYLLDQGFEEVDNYPDQEDPEVIKYQIDAKTVHIPQSIIRVEFMR